MRDVTADRKKLIDIGAAGPLAGLLVAIPVIWSTGSTHSQVGPLVAGRACRRGTRSSTRCSSWLVEGRLAARRPARRVPAPDRLGRLGRPAGHDDQPAADRPARRRAHRDRLLRQPLQPVRARACTGCCRSARSAVFAWVLHAVQRRGRARAGDWSSACSIAAERGAALAGLVRCWSALMRRLSGGVNHPPVDDKPLPREPARCCSG